MLPSMVNLVKLGDQLVLLSFAAFLIKIYFFSEPFVRGFICADPSLGKPLNPLTVSMMTIIIMSTLVPCLLIIVTETNGERLPTPRLKLFAFSSLVNLSLTLYAKFVVGRLRPHFMAVCRPQVHGGPCTPGTWVPGDAYGCENSNLRQTNQARQSFFSGHASISMNAAVYVILYVQLNYSPCLLRSWVQFVVLLAGLYPGVTQVNNYWHHWDDVAVGYAVGAGCAVLNYRFVEVF